jgi:hypothetical protein
MGDLPESIIFQRKSEPTEGAFSAAVPQGWEIKGGVMRANPMNQAVSAQTIEAKVDVGIQQDASGKVMIRFCPQIKYCDMRYSPAGAMGLFPPGSNYQGMIVCPVMPAQQFLAQMMFPWAHPQASQAQMVEAKPVPEHVQPMQQQAAGRGLPFTYDGCLATITYVEGGVAYREMALCIIENMGQMAAGMWSNRVTRYYRAPAEEFNTWEPVLKHIESSVEINQQWLAQEIVRQEFLSKMFRNAQEAQQARNQRALEVQRELQETNRQIVEHRQRTNAEIRNDHYLTMTNQEEYINPYTQQVDTGSNQWNYRWVNDHGDEFYSNGESDDPNHVQELNSTEWKRSAIRPRFPS